MYIVDEGKGFMPGGESVERKAVEDGPHEAEDAPGGFGTEARGRLVEGRDGEGGSASTDEGYDLPVGEFFAQGHHVLGSDDQALHLVLVAGGLHQRCRVTYAVGVCVFRNVDGSSGMSADADGEWDIFNHVLPGVKPQSVPFYQPATCSRPPRGEYCIERQQNTPPVTL